MAKWRILVVDDEDDVRAIIATTLRPHYEIVEAHDGLDALEKLERAEPDFVLMDVMMPLMDGYQACAAIRKHRKYHDLPIMFLSALGTKEDIRKGYTTGANLYLTKPFEPSRLLRNIDVFFETTPPRRTPKQFNIEQLQGMEKAPTGPRPSIHEAETIADFAVPSAPAPTSESAAEPPAPPQPQLAAPAEVEPEAPAPAPPSAAAGAVKPRIMIVDDDAEIVSLMTMVLGNEFEISYARDGLQAIERIVRHQPDVVIVDIMLPKMSGFQLCQSLRANKSFAKTPILVCSAKTSDRDVAYAKRVGATDFLGKPFRSDELVARLEQFLRTPGFTVRPKSLPYSAVHSELLPAGQAEDAFELDTEVRRAESVPGAAPDTDKAVKDFLKKEKAKDAFGREEEPKKKRRFLFGFGKDKE